MKNTLFKKVLAVALACTMTFSMATVTHAADAKEITIGVTSFADTLEPTEQYFSWVVSRYAIGECLTKFDEEGGKRVAFSPFFDNLRLVWSPL